MIDRVRDLARALGFEDARETLESVKAVYRRIDDAVGRPQLKLPCKAGCSDCCYESVFVSAPEFLVVAEQVFHWAPQRQKALLYQMTVLAADFADEIELLGELPPGAERDEVATRVRFRCPLLDQAERCSVYSARELNGRTFGASWDSRRGHPYGCERTHERFRSLRVLEASVVDARTCRSWLVDAVPNTELVQVYPYWFSHYREFFLPSEEE